MKKIYILEISILLSSFMIFVKLIDINEKLSIIGSVICLTCIIIVPIITRTLTKNISKEKESKKSIIFTIAISLIIFIFCTIFISFEKSCKSSDYEYDHEAKVCKKKINKEEMKLEIQAYAYEMLVYANNKKKNNPSINCVSIFPIKNNYTGSVDVSTDNYYIWLSDGTFYIYGTEDNLELTESSEDATVECKNKQ